MPDGTTTTTTTIAVVGIGGYGNNYVTALLDAPSALSGGIRVVGVADPNPQACRRLGELEARGVGVYTSIERLYAKQSPDLCILSTPLQLHASQTALAASRGSHVLCEKPLCVTPEQIAEMKRARDASGKLIAIGYQWSFSVAIQALKADILAGHFGRPKRLRVLVLWPRDEAYYSRNRWAGAKADAAGNLVLDSPVNNACAHYLHNLLYLLGDAVDRSVLPATLTAELYRAHPIENYDTAALRGVTPGGAEILFIVSHATRGRSGPVFSCEFERGTVDYTDKSPPTGPPTPNSPITATFADGTHRTYGSPNEARDRKLWLTVDAIRQGKPTLCGIEAAAAHTLSTWAAQQSMPEITTLDRALVHVEGPAGQRKTWVDHLGTTLQRCYDEGKLPSELGVAWARPGRAVPIART